MNYKRLISIGSAVTLLAGFSFATFNRDYEGYINTATDRLKQIALNWKADYQEMKDKHDELYRNLTSLEDTLVRVRETLEDIYFNATGEVYDVEANGDILQYDFSEIVDNNVMEDAISGDAIRAALGLEESATLEDIIAEIETLKASVISLEAQIEVLNGQITDLQNQMNTMEQEFLEDEQNLIGQIEQLQTKLENANAEIVAGNEAQERELEALNEAITELGGEAVVPEAAEPEEEEEPEVEKVLTYNYVGDWSAATHKEQFDNTMAQAVGDFKDDVNLQLQTDNNNMISVYTDNQEFYNQITSHEHWNDRLNGECFYIDNDGNIVDKATGQANSYYRVRIMYEANL